LALIAESTRKKVLQIFDVRLPQGPKAVGIEVRAQYPFSETSYFGLPTIQATREAWKAMLTTCSSVPSSRFLSALESSGWMDYLSLLMKATSGVVECIERGVPALIHCVEGCDQTTQICSLSQLCMDSHYRSIRGFAQLIEKDWLSFGHPFELRLSHSVPSSTDNSPVFLQFLDCVFQLIQQFPAHFEFNECLLLELAQVAFSGRFGTFFCNSHKERLSKQVYVRTHSVWTYVLSEIDQFRNPYYQGDQNVLRPNWSVRRLQVWHELFFKWHSDFFYPILRMASVRQHKDIILRTANSGMELYRKQLAETQVQLAQIKRQLQQLQKTA
jgi:myotubularin-related protein 1/2